MQSKQSRLSLLAAMAAPIAHFCGCGWLSAVVTAAAAAPLILLKKNWTFSKPVALAQMVWLGIVAGVLLPFSSLCWPSDNDLAVPLTLLTLAALTRAANAPRIGAVLAFFMGLLTLPIALSGAAHLEPAWLRPAKLTWEPMLALVLLLAALPGEDERKGSGILAVGFLTAAAAALIQGVLSPAVAAALPDPEYQTARTLGHLEPVAAAAMTLGWYAAASRIFASAARIARLCQMGEGLPYVLLWGTAAATVVFRWQLSATYLVVMSTVFWYFVPFFHKNKKVKNST